MYVLQCFGQAQLLLPGFSPSCIAGHIHFIFAHSLHSRLWDDNNMLYVAPGLCPVMLVHLLSMTILNKGWF